ncbi:type II toxin-antitoxin system ParD family antitoxin [Inquilinus sp. YAF38]|uniref:type II toxin-antitoxin system ParD family antitoxin n=1 Tax=Inquilinus sp. YAF38 TaxID=3233084 RepID=UPI003F929F0C
MAGLRAWYEEFILRGSASHHKDSAMPSVAKRTFSLPREQADYIDSLVASGNYASSSEVIRAGLRALQERDAAVDRWLRDEVVPVATAMQAAPGRAIAAETVFGEIRALHRRRVKSGGRDS